MLTTSDFFHYIKRYSGYDQLFDLQQKDKGVSLSISQKECISNLGIIEKESLFSICFHNSDERYENYCSKFSILLNLTNLNKIKNYHEFNTEIKSSGLYEFCRSSELMRENVKRDFEYWKNALTSFKNNISLFNELNEEIKSQIEPLPWYEKDKINSIYEINMVALKELCDKGLKIINETYENKEHDFLSLISPSYIQGTK